MPKLQRMMLQLGDTLFNAGDAGTSLYILVSGRLVTLSAVDGLEVKVLEAGEIIGELAALRLNKTRTLTLRAKSSAVVYCLWADDFEFSLSDVPEDYASLREEMKASALRNYADRDWLMTQLDPSSLAAPPRLQGEGPRGIKFN